MDTSKPYGKLLLMAALSFVAMYALMYAMADSLSSVYPNINEFYMAGLMTMPMVVIELLVMGGMYMNRKLNLVIVIGSVVALALFFICIRIQFGVGDRQFLKSMIPHHSAAILMCEKANISDPDIKELCRNIVAGQQQEIDQMEAKLGEINSASRH